MNTRRQLLALGAVAGMAGCLGEVLGDGPIVVSAQPAGIDADVREDAGYDLVREESVELEETVSALGVERDVRATNWFVEFGREIDLAGIDLPTDDVNAGTVAVLSTPSVSVAGRSFNPVATMSADELAELIQSEYEGIDSLEELDEESATVLDESTTVTRFAGEADLAGTGITVDVILHVSEAVSSGDDLVIVLGGYPAVVEEEEADRVRAMFGGVHHPA